MTPLADLTPLTEVLPPTKAGKPRALRFYPRVREHGYACDHVAVVEERGRGCESYGLTEFPVEGGRGFVCRKPGDPVGYSVFVSAFGDADDCTCAGGCFRRADVAPCRHVLAVRAALENGWIAPPAAEYPADEPYTDEELEALAAEYAAEERIARGDSLRVA